MTLRTLHINIEEQLYEKLREKRLFPKIHNLVARLLESYIENMNMEETNIDQNQRSQLL